MTMMNNDDIQHIKVTLWLYIKIKKHATNVFENYVRWFKSAAAVFDSYTHYTWKMLREKEKREIAI